MSSSADDDTEDDVEFVSEGPSRPVLECIDLLSDREDNGSSPTEHMIEDEIQRQKDHVTSTLERLARQVAVEKKNRAEKCRAFKERQLSQKAHGQKELTSPGGGDSYNAKRCVDMWLKMPGVTPGGVNTGMGWRRRTAPPPSSSSSNHTCPVINCGRVYDSVGLMAGHLKRFDHSPCDPTVTLKGGSTEQFACVACGLHFHTMDEWNTHLQSKVVLPSADGHASDQSCQVIVCYACPSCYHLFYLRDECLQHMAATNHFSQFISLSCVGTTDQLYIAFTTGSKQKAMPVPVPRYARNRLTALCKEVGFRVRCSLCRKVLTSHMEAKAHFNVQCREGCAVAEADQTVAEVMRQLRAHGQCPQCLEVFLSQPDADRHSRLTQHRVEVTRTMDRALLQYCHVSEALLAKRTRPQGDRQARGLETSTPKRDQGGRGELAGSPAKRPRLGQGSGAPAGSGEAGERGGRGRSVPAWFCECGLRFPDEASVNNHLLAANQIFHQCGVCGKLTGEASIARLHMSRFHGGAHLSNFLFHCRKCKVDMPRQVDILSHVSDAHSGHTYFLEREVPEEPVSAAIAKPSTSGRQGMGVHPELQARTEKPGPGPAPARQPPPGPRAPQGGQGRWMCRMCEDVFPSEASVVLHCSDPDSHIFQRFVCAHCPQKFFKEATLRRHCSAEHEGQLGVRFFCGLCDSMQYDARRDFLEHYDSLHSRDFYRMDEPQESSAAAARAGEEAPREAASSPAPGEALQGALCPCMAPEKPREGRKARYKACMQRLGCEGGCLYVCAPCGVTNSAYAQMKIHVHTSHPALGLEPSFQVQCQACRESHEDVRSFHSHYHAQHCPMDPCATSRTGAASSRHRPGGKQGSGAGPRVKQGSGDAHSGEKASRVDSKGGMESQAGCGTAETAPPTGQKQPAVKMKIESNEEMRELVPDSSVSRISEDRGEESDEEMKQALALSAEEAKTTALLDTEIELALQRSLLEY
ncbi:E3 SUMO-protein ligase ZNF451 [Osmerus eperlanus]|uniref:E3 SUMO-protein ligase ZNF451 n=1 Tax=Osmerus eperlanus TaxID=29151 RepID=UPI002E0E13BA